MGKWWFHGIYSWFMIAKPVNTTSIILVFGTQITILTGVYKPTYNCGAPHCSICLFFWPNTQKSIPYSQNSTKAICWWFFVFFAALKYQLWHLDPYYIYPIGFTNNRKPSCPAHILISLWSSIFNIFKNTSPPVSTPPMFDRMWYPNNLLFTEVRLNCLLWKMAMFRLVNHQYCHLFLWAMAYIASIAMLNIQRVSLYPHSLVSATPFDGVVFSRFAKCGVNHGESSLLDTVTWHIGGYIVHKIFYSIMAL